MLLDKAELERRLNSGNNILNKLPKRDQSTRVPLHITKQNGTKNIPTPLKIVAGVLAKTEPAKEIAEAFDMSVGSVRRAANSDNKEVSAAVERTTAKIRDMALDKLMQSLGIIDDTTLADCSAKDASQVARNLATVVNQLSPKDQHQSGATLIIYAPRQKSEEQYQTIDVQAVG